MYKKEEVRNILNRLEVEDMNSFIYAHDLAHYPYFTTRDVVALLDKIAMKGSLEVYYIDQHCPDCGKAEKEMYLKSDLYCEHCGGILEGSGLAGSVIYKKVQSITHIGDVGLTLKDLYPEKDTELLALTKKLPHYKCLTLVCAILLLPFILPFMFLYVLGLVSVFVGELSLTVANSIIRIVTNKAGLTLRLNDIALKKKLDNAVTASNWKKS